MSPSSLSSTFNQLSLSSSSDLPTCQSVSSNTNPSTIITTHTTTSTSSRQTSKQANERRTIERQEKLLREAAFKGATVFVEAYKNGFLKCFSSVDEIVSRVNSLFGKSEDPLILSHEIVVAVKEGRVNKSPPKQGPKYRLGEEVMALLSDLFFSHNALSQHIASGQMSRQQYASVLQSIVSPKVNMSDWRNLNKEIEFRNNYRQNINTMNPRQAIRVEWFNTQNLISHYNNFEAEMVRFKFARWSTKQELETCNERIKWFDNQRKRVINGDEISFGLDTDSNNLGGRPTMHYVANDVKDAGEADQHSSTKMTIFVQ